MQVSPQNSMLLQSAQHEGNAIMLTNVSGKIKSFCKVRQIFSYLCNQSPNKPFSSFKLVTFCPSTPKSGFLNNVHDIQNYAIYMKVLISDSSLLMYLCSISHSICSFIIFFCGKNMFFKISTNSVCS